MTTNHQEDLGTRLNARLTEFLKQHDISEDDASVLSLMGDVNKIVAEVEGLDQWAPPPGLHHQMTSLKAQHSGKVRNIGQSDTMDELSSRLDEMGTSAAP